MSQVTSAVVVDTFDWRRPHTTRTLKMTLEAATETHGWHEVVERLTDMAHERAQLTGHLRPDLADRWSVVTKHLEKALEELLVMPR